jgi:hypothetical protein
LTHENIYYLLPLIYTCEYVYIYSAGFRYSFGFRVSAGLVLVIDFHSNRCSVRVWVSTLGFGFGCMETPPDPNPTRCHPYNRLSLPKYRGGKHSSHLIDRQPNSER